MTTGRQLSLLDATLLVMGGIIGVGIFFNPADVAAAVPSTGPYLLAWLLGAVAALCGAMTFAELSAAFPHTGGWYVFLREGFGRFVAFLFAWVVLFVVSTGACALVAGFMGSQVAALVGEGAPNWLPAAAASAAIVGITALALRGVKASALFQNACMALKLGAIGTLVVAGFMAVAPGDPGVVQAAARPMEGSLFTGLIAASLPVLFSFGGWQLLSYVAPEVRDPQKNLPRAILLGVGGVAIVYLLVNLAYLRVVGIEGLERGKGFITVMAVTSLGDVGAQFLTAAMAVSAFGFLVVTLVATPGVYVAMSREGLFPAAFGRQHASTGAPVLALLTQCFIAHLYLGWEAGLFTAEPDPAAAGDEDKRLTVGGLTDAVVFAEWIFHALCGLALLRLAKRLGAKRPFKSPLFPLFPATYTAIAFAVVIGNLFTSPWHVTRIGLGVMAIGAIVYLPWSRFADNKSAGE